MSSKLIVALLASASCLVFHSQRPASAQSSGPMVIYAERQPAPQPVRTAYNGQPNRGSGGFIEFLFGDGQSGMQQPQYAPRYQQQHEPQYEPMPSRRQIIAPQQEQQSYEPITPARPGPDPKFEKQLVDYSGKEGPGTIVIDTPSRYLYLVQAGGKAMRYGIGVGKPGFQWAGVKQISAKKEWPGWTPPPEMLKRRPDLPRHMEGGPENPLGARAMYLGSSLYRIHGSNEPWTIGTAVSSGCIRMRNEDVIDLYGRVNVGTRVIVI